jgi:hypothetical protein
VKFKKGIDGTGKTQQKEKDAYWQSVVKDAETLDEERFKTLHAKEWLMRRQAIERIMIDSFGRKAKKWNGQLPRKNLWLWGKTGPGKSRWANSQVPPWNTLKKNCNKWWCGYSGQNTRLVLIEDYPSVQSGGNCLVHHMKLWSDRYPFQGEVKGSSLLIQPGRFCIIVTSNFSIAQCFQNEEDINAIKRRFHEEELTKQNEAVRRAIKMSFTELEDGVDEIFLDEETDWERWKDQFRHNEEVEKANEEAMNNAERAAEEGREDEEEW